ncbi:DUF6519 domain-containing protein [Micromonospora rubida]|uniref:DUF6519 domain-containing protein n=1 Tax=Micromonospora rubida TaxID=2697657 RepID=A0ABW7SKQ7_9ACTN
MKGDFTRRTFRRENHYRSVLLQQGRVQLDADWNEQADIRDHLHRLAARDTFGPHGAPSDAAGMAIAPADGDPVITRGRYYVDGLVCENDGDVPLFAQPDLPDLPRPTESGRHVAYLDVWTEHVTAVERPELREVALGGPDTATRARTIWQVRLAPTGGEDTCADLGDWTPDGGRSTGTMRARAYVAPTDNPDPCVVPVTAGYRRLENQLYRVEIRDTAPPTFVWSRENGSVVARMVAIADNVVTIDAPGRDDRLGFAPNQWVEIIDTPRVRRGEPGYLGRLGAVTDTTLTVAEWAGARPASEDLSEPTVVRRWDSPGPVPIVAGWIDLEDGVQVSFDNPAAVYRTGDYWLVPARSADLSGTSTGSDLAGDVEWPQDGPGNPRALPPDGIDHRYAPIALLDFAPGTWNLVSDCRRIFPPLTGLAVAGYAGGDGQEAVPGGWLPQPLKVSVSGPSGPPATAKVRFTTGNPASDDWGLAGTAGGAVSQTLDVSTTSGIARVSWRPVGGGPTWSRSQQVTARLLDHTDQPVGTPIHFNATLSLADGVWFDPAEDPALGDAHDVQAAIVALARARSLAAVGGDGQDGSPGEVLPEPLWVLVRSRSDDKPIANARVTFTVTSGAVGQTRGDADAVNAHQTVQISTGANGEAAKCYWRLGDATSPVQVLTATLDPATGVVAVPPTTIAFTANASVSVASGVAFTPRAGGELAGTTNVQEALDAADNRLGRLFTARSLVAVGGDGQDAPASGALPRPVRVLVRNERGPVERAKVTFIVTTGTLTDPAVDPPVPPTLSLDLYTDNNGRVSCPWWLGVAAGDPAVQELTATLEDAVGDVVNVPPAQLVFTANRDMSPASEPALHVTGVELAVGDSAAGASTTPLTNDGVVESTQLRDGIRIVLDGQPDAALVDGKPVLAVTLQLPYPLSTADRALWGTDAVVGTIPVALAGAVAPDPDNPNALLWRPTDAAATFVESKLFPALPPADTSRVLAYLILTGRAVADTQGPRQRILNGLAYGRPGAGGATDLALPTVDDVRGSDFVLWFWLVRSRTGLVILPRRGGLFRLKTVRDMVDLAVARAELRAGLPSGVRVAEEHEVDLTAARRAADRAFRGDTERRLRLVADDRYAAAATVLRDALAQIDVPVDVAGAGDSVEVMRTRLDGDDRFDGLLTDATTAARIAEEGGFAEAIPL